MTTERCSCGPESDVPQIRSISDDDVAAENSWTMGDESLEDEDDGDDSLHRSDGDLGEGLACTELYIVDGVEEREEDGGAKDTSTERSRCRLANGL